MEEDVNGAVLAWNGFGADGLRTRYTSNPVNGASQTQHYAFDPTGNLSNRLDPNGVSANTTVFDAFGSLRGQINAATGQPEVNPDPVGFSGQWGGCTDPETKLVLMTHRYYDPSHGRWLNRDPIGYRGGLNLYGYCGNNPVTGVDPSGFHVEGDRGEKAINGKIYDEGKPLSLEDGSLQSYRQKQAAEEAIGEWLNENLNYGLWGIEDKNSFSIFGPPVVAMAHGKQGTGSWTGKRDTHEEGARKDHRARERKPEEARLRKLKSRYGDLRGQLNEELDRANMARRGPKGSAPRARLNGRASELIHALDEGELENSLSKAALDSFENAIKSGELIDVIGETGAVVAGNEP